MLLRQGDHDSVAPHLGHDRRRGDGQRQPVAGAEERAAGIARLRRLSYLLDESIRVPGTDYRIGLDPLVGLLPVAGDLPTTAVSAYVVVEAIALGAPRATVYRMLFNLLLDATIGSIPVIGTLFDAVWKANARNVALLEDRLADPSAAPADRRFLLAVGGTLAFGLSALSVATAVAVAWLIGRWVPL